MRCDPCVLISVCVNMWASKKLSLNWCSLKMNIRSRCTLRRGKNQKIKNIKNHQKPLNNHKKPKRYIYSCCSKGDEPELNLMIMSLIEYIWF